MFWNNRRLIGSCLYSLVLARGLFLKRFPPLVATHSAVVLKTALVKLWDPIKCPAFHLDEPIWNIWNILLGPNLEYEYKQIFCWDPIWNIWRNKYFVGDPIRNMWTNKYFAGIQFGICEQTNILFGSNLEYEKKIFGWDPIWNMWRNKYFTGIQARKCVLNYIGFSLGPVKRKATRNIGWMKNPKNKISTKNLQ